MFKGFGAVAVGLVTVITTVHLAPVALAQRGADWDWQGSYDHLTRINAGSFVTVRTSQAIESDRTDGRVFSGVVTEDVWDEYRLAVPSIPQGSRVELIVRTARDGDLVLDLESIFAHGQRYAVSAAPERIDSGNGRPRDNGDAAAAVGGGAILGAIIGSIAGGGKGAAIGAAAGAAAGLGLVVQGRSIRVPDGSVLTFRLDAPLAMGIRDQGYDRGQQHYHRDPGAPAYYPPGR